jgi:hypothetical protein
MRVRKELTENFHFQEELATTIDGSKDHFLFLHAS